MARKQLRLTAFGSYPILANIHLSKKHSTKLINFVSPPGFVLQCVTITAQELKVIPVQSDGRIGEIGCGQVRLVVDYLAGAIDTFGKAQLTQAALAPGIAVAAVLPSLGAIEVSALLVHCVATSLNRCKPPPLPDNVNAPDPLCEHRLPLMQSQGEVSSLWDCP